MRLWSIHPKYLDAKGLVAAWREGLLAQKCLEGKTKGYNNHPQLERFKLSPYPMLYMGTYLSALVDEADKRGYSFNRSKISEVSSKLLLNVTNGQMDYEWEHFMNKIKLRDPKRHEKLGALSSPEPHPLFCIVSGDIESWERTL